MRIKTWNVWACLLTTAWVAGCQGNRAAEPFGKTFYVGGAANFDSFTQGVPNGMREAGYKGDVESFIWTMSFNPLIDQLVTVNARARAGLLTDRIEDYHRKYPDNAINVIALSAGTGVSVWAIERLKNSKIDNLVLLGSSLSHDYDVSSAMRHIKGKIYVYHSTHDQVLEAVRIIGTIDGKRGVDSVGQVGLTKPPGQEGRIVNTAWSRKYMRFGWAGGHTDCINSRFIRHVVAPHLLSGATAKTPRQRQLDRQQAVASSNGQAPGFSRP